MFVFPVQGKGGFKIRLNGKYGNIPPRKEVVLGLFSNHPRSVQKINANLDLTSVSGKQFFS